jgi:hypothetical protein
VRRCRLSPEDSYQASSPLNALELVGAGQGIAFVQASLEWIKPSAVELFARARLEPTLRLEAVLSSNNSAQ